MDSLLVATPVKPNDLPVLLEKYLGKFQDNTYKSSFPWVDHLKEVRDPVVRAELDAEMLDALRSPHPSQRSTWLAVPELIEWAQVGGFRFREGKAAKLYTDLRATDFMSTVSDASVLDVAGLRRRHVFAFDIADEHWIGRWSIYSCIYSEVEHEGTTYVLSGGGWYRVERDFVASVNSTVAALVAPTWLPRYADTSEGVYNSRVANASGGTLALVDRKLVRIGGSPIEFCDLYGAQRIVHVKRYGGSEVLSHLFSQGSISGDCFLEDSAFRQNVNAMLPPALQLPDPTRRPDPGDYEIVYAVISRSPKSVDKILPFFSRLNLRNAARRLRLYGYRVSLTKVEA
jgi:uncharacterized protein (TIGR04141 family)